MFLDMENSMAFSPLPLRVTKLSLVNIFSFKIVNIK